VDASDLVRVRNRGGTSVTNPGVLPNNSYDPFYDVDGSGAIDAGDLVKVRNRGGTALPDSGGGLGTAAALLAPAGATSNTYSFAASLTLGASALLDESRKAGADVVLSALPA
jgi:hypothetical protein